MAEKTKRLGLAVPTTEPRRAHLRGARNGDYNPNGIDVVDIDAAVESSGIAYIGSGSGQVDTAAMGRALRDPVTGTEFVEVDRGPARIGLAKVS